MPTREVHYYVGKEKGQEIGLILLYTDRPALEYWTPFVQDDYYDHINDKVNYHDQAEVYDKNGNRCETNGKQIRNSADTVKLKEQFFNNLIEPDDMLKIIHDILEKMELSEMGEEFEKVDHDDIWDIYNGDISKLRNPEIKKALHKIAQTIVKYGIRDWSREPYGAACYSWEPGVKSWEILERLKAFSLIGSTKKNIHICGESFSDYNGFIEGSLRSACNVLKEIPI
jgi:hypothetical protein